VGSLYEVVRSPGAGVDCRPLIYIIGSDFAILDFALAAIRLIMFFLRENKLAAAGSCVYLLVVACASLYPVFDHRTFSGLAAVLLAWPWIDYFPSRLLPLGIALNAVLIYAVLFSLQRLSRLLRPSPK